MISRRKKALVCPLNWGLGHASRDVPVIQKLIEANMEVIVAAYGGSLNWLKSEFPDIRIIELPGYQVRYAKIKSQVVAMLRLLPRIFFWTLKEHFIVKGLIQKYNVDVVISDHRYGLFNRNTYNVFITHQLRVKFPGLFRSLEWIYISTASFFINKFDECWIPDFEHADNLSGELSHGDFPVKNLFYIQPQSRFNYQPKQRKEDIDVLFILSGPEPQRAIFEKTILHQTRNSKLKLVLVRGTEKEVDKNSQLEVYNLAHTDHLDELISRAKLIICRSGYSSVMDLFALRKTAVLVPTPGQTEQTYLARYLFEKKYFYTMTQEEFSLNHAIQHAIEFPVEKVVQNENALDQRIAALKVK